MLLLPITTIVGCLVDEGFSSTHGKALPAEEGTLLWLVGFSTYELCDYDIIAGLFLSLSLKSESD